MKPWSPSSCTDGDSRTTPARTPREAKPSVSSSAGARGVALRAGASSSVLRRPGERPASPEVLRKGRSEPASAVPMVSMARRSTSHEWAKFEKSWMNPQWIVPSVVPAPVRRLSRSFEAAVVRLGTGGHKRRGPLVRAGEAEHPVPGVDEFSGDGGADESGRAGQEYTHIMEVSRWVGRSEHPPGTAPGKVVTLYRYND